MGLLSHLVTLAVAATAANGAAVPSCSNDAPQSPAGDVSVSGKFVSHGLDNGKSSFGGHKKLSQQQTNGASTFGTYHHPTLPPFIDGPKPGGSRWPWGNRKCNDTNPYNPSDIPNTGMTRQYDWTITNTTLAPDGVELPLLVVNGQYPGPQIEANWGDWIEVTVHNELEIEGTALHWHGFLQTGTPWYDGVPTVSQCPIAPGKTLTYRFRAELYGTSWWHGHHSAQYLNGLVGPIVVHGPKSDAYDIDLGPVLVQDWFHAYYVNLLEQVYHASETGPILPPMANNMLINGKANYQCNNTQLACTPNAGMASFAFKTGKKHLLRLINPSAEAIIFFSIDGYNMTVVANDFVPVEPYMTDLVTLGVGQRTEVIVEGRHNPEESVWMRITEGPSGLGPAGQTGCSLNDGKAFTTTAGIYYEEANQNIEPNTTSPINPSRYLFPAACGNPDLGVAKPVFQMPISDPEKTLNFVMTGADNATGEFVWYMNNITYEGDYNDPVFLDALTGTTNFTKQRQVYDMGSAKSLRIVMTSVGFPASHPMHIHGHNMYVLAEGVGKWDGTIVNPSNPQRRDTQLIRPNGYLVVQIDLDNPGMWPFHCHVAWHVSEGMNINILEQTPSVQHDLHAPASIAQTCRDWWSWTNGHIVPQIDSGL